MNWVKTDLLSAFLRDKERGVSLKPVGLVRVESGGRDSMRGMSAAQRVLLNGKRNWKNYLVALSTLALLLWCAAQQAVRTVCHAIHAPTSRVGLLLSMT